MSITDTGFTLSAYGAGWSVPPTTPAVVAEELNKRLGPGRTITATVYDGNGNSATATRQLDGWVVTTAQVTRPWHRQLQLLLANTRGTTPDVEPDGPAGR